MQGLPRKQQDIKGQIYAQSRILADIKNQLCKGGVTGSASEATLAELLIQVKEQTEAEVIKLCKCDDNTGTGGTIVEYVEATAHVYADGVLTTTSLGTFTDQSLTIVYASTGVAGPCDIGVASLLQEKRCRVDDVNGDGTSLIPFTDIVSYNSDGTQSVLAEYNSNGTAYISINSLDPNSVGLPATGKAGMRSIVNGGNWSPNGLISSFAFHIDGTSDGSSFLDSDNVLTTDLPDSFQAFWDFSGNLSDTTPVVTSGPTARIIINYTTF
jgi:hypothetical protein